MTSLIIPTPAPTGVQLPDASTTDIEWAPFSAPYDAPSYARMFNRIRRAHVTRGRPLEYNQFATGAFDADADNGDRALDPNYSGGRWFGGVEPERQARMRIEDAAGNSYPVWTGFLDGFPQHTDWSSRDSTVALSGGDVFKMLAQVPLPSSMYEMAVATDTPSHWWKLDEKAGVTAIDSGFSTTPMPGIYSAAPTIGSASIVPYDGGRTSVAFEHVSQNVVSLAAQQPFTDYPFTIEAWVDCASDPASGRVIYAVSTGTGNLLWFALDYTGDTFGTGLGDSLVLSIGHAADARNVNTNAAIADGSAHHVVAVAASATSYTLYVDGVAVPQTVTTSGPGSPTMLPGLMHTIGNWVAASGLGLFGLQGSASQVAIYPAALTAAQIANHYNAGANAFAGSGTGTQAARVSDYVGIPAARRAIQTGSSLIGSSDLPGGDALSYLQTLAKTEQGQFYADRDGILTWRQRTDLLTATRSLVSQATFGDGPIPFRTMTANTTATSTAITGASPAFTAADVGAIIVGPGIPTGTTLAAQAGTSGTLSAAATLTQTSATLHLGEYTWVDLDFAFDETRVWNDVTIGRAGGAPQRVIDPVSRRRYGPRGFQPDTSRLYANDNDALDMANWTLTHNAYAIQRIRSITINAYGDAGRTAAVLNREIGDRITAVARPQGLGSPIVQDLIIEGITVDTAPGICIVKFACSAAETQQYWVLGDSTLSVLGSTTRLAA